MNNLWSIYYSVNFFIAGFVLAVCINELDRKNISIFKCFLLVIGCLLLGTIGIFVILLLLLLKKIWDVINNYFQLEFFFSYHFLGGYKNLSLEVLEIYNKRAYFLKNKKSLGHKLFFKAVELINERNEYTYIHENNI